MRIKLVVVVTVIVVMALSLTGCCLFNRPPQAMLRASPTKGPLPLTVEFDGSGSVDSDGEIVEYRWDFGDGKDGAGKIVAHVYDSAGSYQVTLTVTDDDGATDQESKQIVVAPKGSLRNLVIYELLPNPSGDEPADEYIKLYNRSDERVSIAGWLLTDGEGSYRIPHDTEIDPHGFWTVYGSTYNPTGCPVCLYLANEGDCVQLLEAGANLTDECCYSTTGMDQVIRCH